MALPDWGPAISTQINAFMGWSTVATLVAVTVGVSVGAAILSQFLRVFHR